jgi:hypothetical protein
MYCILLCSCCDCLIGHIRSRRVSSSTLNQPGNNHQGKVIIICKLCLWPNLRVTSECAADAWAPVPCRARVGSRFPRRENAAPISTFNHDGMELTHQTLPCISMKYGCTSILDIAILQGMSSVRRVHCGNDCSTFITCSCCRRISEHRMYNV